MKIALALAGRKCQIVSKLNFPARIQIKIAYDNDC